MFIQFLGFNKMWRGDLAGFCVWQKMMTIIMMIMMIIIIMIMMIMMIIIVINIW